MPLKKTFAVAVVLTLALATLGSAADRGVAEIGAELEALGQAISAQTKLLALYERQGKQQEAGRARARLLELVKEQKKVLADLEEAVTGKPLPPAEGDPVSGRRIGVGGKGGFVRRPALGKPGDATKLALDWLSHHQAGDGSWDCDGFAKDCHGAPCDGQGGPHYDPGVTGLAVMAFLGAGETHKHGGSKNSVGRGLKHLRQIQDPEGCFGTRRPFGFVYNHAIATIAMCEAYSMTASPLFKKSSQLAADFVMKARNPYLAWRYGVRTGENDTSVTAWMVAALHSAKRAGLRVDDNAFVGALAWLDKVTEPEFGRVGYTTLANGPARKENLVDLFPAERSESLTAAGIAIRCYAGREPEKDELIRKGVDLCLKKPPVWNRKDGSIDMYYWYWGAIGLELVGGEPWTLWSQAMFKVLTVTQRADGCAKGSWDPVGAWGTEGGRVYSTAILALVSGMLDRRAAKGAK